jgi:hypothetical protein
MSTFLVISFHADPRDLDDPADMVQFPTRTSRVTKQAEALGGKLCAFGPLSFSFAFPLSDIEDPIAWAAEVAAKENALPRLSGGISHGELVEIIEPQALSAIAWGRALIVSAALASSAHPGEVLVDPDVPEVVDIVRSTGTRWVSGGATAIAAISVDPVRPLIGESGVLFMEFEQATRPKDDEPDGSGDTADQARQALLRGDIEALDTSLSELQTSGENPALVERLTGLLALDRGAKDEALRTLRQAAENEMRPGFKTRARLAHAIALASNGRSESALLEALTALAAARETDDHAGEAAIARFLSQLSLATGHSVAASVWQHVVELASG